MTHKRVTVRVPGAIDYVRRGEQRGTFDNGRGRWASVLIDGQKAVRWFWHEYVTVDAMERAA